MDLSTVREVPRAAAEIKRRLDRVDTLVNKTGETFPRQRTETEEGKTQRISGMIGATRVIA